MVFKDKLLTKMLILFCVLLIAWLYIREDLVKETIAHATKLLQAVADSLFNLPSAEDASGPIVSLPPPTTKLPREKPVCYFLVPICLLAFCLCVHWLTCSCVWYFFLNLLYFISRLLILCWNTITLKVIPSLNQMTLWL